MSHTEDYIYVVVCKKCLKMVQCSYEDTNVNLELFEHYSGKRKDFPEKLLDSCCSCPEAESSDGKISKRNFNR